MPKDRRIVGRDGRRYGPMPGAWAHYRGLYRHGDRVVLAYTVGAADVLETPSLETDPAQPGVPIFARTLEIGPSTVAMSMRVAPERVGRGPRRRSCRGPSVAKRRVDRAERAAVRDRRGSLKVLMSDGDAEGARGVRVGIARGRAARLIHPRRPAAMARGPRDAAGHRPR